MELKEITASIQQYLKIETDYALFLTGRWGTGKTTFVRGELASGVKVIETPHDGRKRYELVHVLLNSIQSISELHNKVYLSIYPFLKSNAARAAKVIAKHLYSKTIEGDVDDVFKEMHWGKLKKRDLRDIVLCLDDLERRDAALTVQQIAAFINGLVEEDNIKVIVVANDQKLESDADGTKHEQLKDKVIGHQISFSQNTLEVARSLVEKHTGSRYKTYLLSRLNVLVDALAKANGNIRDVKYFIKQFEWIYNSIYCYAESYCGTAKRIPEAMLETMDSLVTFGIAVAIEYKHHRLTASEAHDIDNEMFAWLSNLKQDGKKDESYADSFKANYFGQSSYYFSEAVYQHMTGGRVFHMGRFQEEIGNRLGLSLKSSAQTQLLNQMRTHQVFEMDDGVYMEKLRELVDYAESGAFNFFDYLSVSYAVAFFECLSDRELDSAFNKIKIGVDKSSNKLTDRETQETLNDRQFRVHPEHPQATRIEEIRIYMGKITEKQRLLRRAQSIAEVANSMREGFKVLQASLLEGGPLHQWHTELFFDQIDIEEAEQQLYNGTNADARALYELLLTRYSHNYNLERFKEREAMRNLVGLLNQRIESGQLSQEFIKRAIYNHIVQELTSTFAFNQANSTEEAITC